MKDRVPTPGKANRVKITMDDGTAVEGVLSYADDATQEGSAYTKGNVLPDDVCELLGLDSDLAEPKDAFNNIIVGLKKGVLRVIVKDFRGNPMPNIHVDGITGIPSTAAVTNSNGEILSFVDAGEYTLSIENKYIDVTTPSQAVSIDVGESKTITLQQESTGTEATIESTQNVMFSDNVFSVDVFCCGGGGGGGGAFTPLNTKSGGGGGGGGYTATKLNATFQSDTQYSAVVGAGGAGGPAVTVNGTSDQSGGRGGTSSFLGCSAYGGFGGFTPGNSSGSKAGGNGGSGGGGANFGASSAAGAGGSDGEDGGTGGNGAPGGSGQGTTTRAFGDPSGTLCAGGGGGGGGSNGTAGAYGSGTYGRGGRGANRSGSGSNGLDGVVMVRWVFKS